MDAQDARKSSELGFSIDRDDRRSTQAEIVLKRDLGAWDLALVGLSTDLPGELRALRKPGGSEGMTLGDQPTRGVDHPFPPVGHRSGVDELAALTLLAQPERF